MGQESRRVVGDLLGAVPPAVEEYGSRQACQDWLAAFRRGALTLEELIGFCLHLPLSEHDVWWYTDKERMAEQALQDYLNVTEKPLRNEATVRHLSDKVAYYHGIQRSAEDWARVHAAWAQTPQVAVVRDTLNPPGKSSFWSEEER